MQLIVPLLTPLADDPHAQLAPPDPGRLAEHARALAEEGAAGFVLFGTTGEATSFSVAERSALLDALVDDEGLDPKTMLVGGGAAALPDALALTAHAMEKGARGVLALPPFYYKAPAPPGLLVYYEALAARLAGSETRLFFYHFPKLSGVPLVPELIEEVASRHPGVVGGVKDSSGDRASLAAFLELGPELEVYPGTERLLEAPEAMNAAGLISATANVNAEGLVALLEGDAARDEGLRRVKLARALEVRAAFEAEPMIPALKAVIAARRADPAWRRVRPPFVELEKGALPALEEALATR